jgi:predicted DNA-binding protein (MmcQ/YjbR family)
VNDQVEEAALRRLREICGDLPRTVERTSYGHPAFAVGRELFAVIETYRGALSLAIRVGPQRQSQLLGDDRFYLTPYVGKRGWVSLRLLAAPLDWDELADLLADSHRRLLQG